MLHNPISELSEKERVKRLLVKKTSVYKYVSSLFGSENVSVKIYGWIIKVCACLWKGVLFY